MRRLVTDTLIIAERNLVRLTRAPELLIGYTIRAVNDHSNSTPVGPNSTTSAPASAGVALSSLPKEVAQTVSLIKQGGPFPYRQDGVVYSNLERRLPIKPSGLSKARSRPR